MDSYIKFGFAMPQVPYTDNVEGDRPTIESVITSLTENVQHVKPTQKEQIEMNRKYKDLPIAVLQIAHQEKIYVLQIHQFERNALPGKLVEDLKERRITKMGVKVHNDLKRLDYWDDMQNLPGHLESGTFWVDKGAIENRSASLETICCEVLGVRLNKDR
jgi:hypothetical protein